MKLPIRDSGIFNYPESFNLEIDSLNDLLPYKKAKEIISESIISYKDRTGKLHPINESPFLRDAFIFEVGNYLINYSKYGNKKEIVFDYRYSKKQVLNKKIEIFDLYFTKNITFEELVFKLADEQSYLTPEYRKNLKPNIYHDLIYNELNINHGTCSYSYKYFSRVLRKPRRLISTILFYRLMNLLKITDGNKNQNILNPLLEIHAKCELEFIEMGISIPKDDKDKEEDTEKKYLDFIHGDLKDRDLSLVKFVKAQVDEFLRQKNIDDEIKKLMEEVFKTQYKEITELLKNDEKTSAFINAFKDVVSVKYSKDGIRQALENDFIPERILNEIHLKNSPMFEKMFINFSSDLFFNLKEDYQLNKSLFIDCFQQVYSSFLLTKYFSK